MTVQLSLLDRDWCDLNAPIVLNEMRGRQFTTDDLHAILPAPDNVNLFGVLMARLRCSRQIRRVGDRISKRPEANGRRIGCYEVSDLTQ